MSEAKLLPSSGWSDFAAVRGDEGSGPAGKEVAPEAAAVHDDAQGLVVDELVAALVDDDAGLEVDELAPARRSAIKMVRSASVSSLQRFLNLAARLRLAFKDFATIRRWAAKSFFI